MGSRTGPEKTKTPRTRCERSARWSVTGALVGNHHRLHPAIMTGRFLVLSSTRESRPSIRTWVRIPSALTGGDGVTATRARRLTVRTGAALAWLVGTLLPLFALAQLARSLGENFCGVEGHLPTGVSGYSGPSWTGPTRLTCRYDGYGSATFTDWTPVTSLVLAAALWLAWSVLVWWTARRLSRPVAA